ncbi:MAG: hypothetical protein ABR879_08555 [Methanomassiliicoccales archaeon]
MAILASFILALTSASDIIDHLKGAAGTSRFYRPAAVLNSLSSRLRDAI